MLELNWSGYLGHFKKNLGGINHNLITILIGLEGVRAGKVTKDESFNVTWNPHSIEDSAVKSRRFARNAALAWSIDTLDAYLSSLAGKPFVFDDLELIKSFSSRSVYKKFNEIIRFCNYPINLPLSLVQLGIQWRNNVIHFKAENELDSCYKDFLKELTQEAIDARFCGLNAQIFLDNFERRESPTFKEVAAIIQSIHFLVLELDKTLIKFVNYEQYIDHLIKNEANENAMNNIIASQPQQRMKKFEQFLMSNGFKVSNKESTLKNLTEKEIEEILSNYIKKKREFVSRK